MADHSIYLTMASSVNDPCPCGSGKKYKKCCGLSKVFPPQGKHVSSGSRIEQAMQTALYHHQRGELQQAETLYRNVLDREPENVDALHLLGVIAHQLGKHESAVEHISRAIALSPNVAEFYNSYGEAIRAMGDLKKAITLYAQAVALKPDFAMAQNNLGVTYQALGKFDEARACYEKAVFFSPGFSEAHFNLGNLFHEQNQLEAAIACYQRALSLAPNHAMARFNLGNALLTLERFEDAIAAYQQAIAIHPELAAAHNNLGNAYRAMGLDNEAISSFQKAHTLNPRNSTTLNNLGNMFRAQARYREARAYYEMALGINPAFAEAYYNLGNTLREEGDHDRAIAAYGKALSLRENFADAHYNLGITLQEQCKLDAATEHYEKALAIKRNDGIKVRLATMLPAIMQSREEISRGRDALKRNIEKLSGENLVLEDPTTEVGMTSFYLAYHGENDHGLQIDIADFYEKLCPTLLYSAPHCQKITYKTPGARIKLGLISKHFFSHTIGKTMVGLIEHFSRDIFEITVFTFPYESDPTAQKINSSADRVVILPKDWKDAHDLVARKEMDILFYTDIGMDPYTYFLAYARLAPIQCTTWGHPVTTGLKNMDYYLTCADFEPDGADEHYTERLVRLSSPPTYYYRPQMPSVTKSRSDYSWDAGMNLYLCPQTLYKFHPDFDEMIAGILYGDPCGQVVLISGKHRHWLDLLLARFKTRMADVMDRIIVLQYPGNDEYLNLLHKCDVVLDTYHYGGGTSSLQALAFGTPIVTLPGNYQRGRHTYAYYKQMNYMECVATDSMEYIDIALRLGTDRGLRDQAKEAILAKNSVLYENLGVVHEMEQFFSKICFNRSFT